VSPLAAALVVEARRTSSLEARKWDAHNEVQRIQAGMTDEWAESFRKEHGRDPTDEEWSLNSQRVSSSALPMRRERWDRLEDEHRNRHDIWLSLSSNLARFAPAFAFQETSTRIAGTGIHRHRRFRDAVRIHNSNHFGWIIKGWARDVLRRFYPERFGAYRWDVSDVPRFDYTITWPEEDVAAAAFDLGILLCWGPDAIAPDR